MLIKCPECGVAVSDKATACPRCGCPIVGYANKNIDNSKENKQKKKDKDESSSKKTLIAITLIVVCIIVIPLCIGVYQNAQREKNFENATENIEELDRNTHATERIIGDIENGTWNPDKDYKRGYGHR